MHVSKYITFDLIIVNILTIKLSIYVQIFVRAFSGSLKSNETKLRIMKKDQGLLELNLLEKDCDVL